MSDRRILIATILRSSGDTGVQTHIRALGNFLEEKGKSYELITPYLEPRWKVFPVFALRKILARSLSVWWYRRWHSYFLYRVLMRRLISGEPCVVYAQCPLSAQMALRARRSERQRVVMVVHFNISQADEWAQKNMISRGGLMFNSIRKLESEILPQLDGLVFVSSFMHQVVLQRTPAIGKVPTQIIPNFLADPGISDCSVFQADLINIGTLEPRKNQRYLLEIISELHRNGISLRLTLIGDGPDRKMLEATSRHLNISHLVNFRGYKEGAAGEIGAHRAYIHAAVMENLPLTIIEAMARGRPVFAPAVGGIPEVLGDCCTRLTIPLSDAPKAAEIIASAFRDKDDMTVAARACRRRFEYKFSDQLVAETLIRFLMD